jgi:hypothetical protein
MEAAAPAVSLYWPPLATALAAIRVSRTAPERRCCSPAVVAATRWSTLTLATSATRRLTSPSRQLLLRLRYDFSPAYPRSRVKISIESIPILFSFNYFQLFVLSKFETESVFSSFHIDSAGVGDACIGARDGTFSRVHRINVIF